MTSNVLPLHFAPSQTRSSQNSNVYNFKISFKILGTFDLEMNTSFSFILSFSFINSGPFAPRFRLLF